MATFLFDKIIFGPVKSRRLGVSLGINLLPNDCKLCSFNCIYCECGWNPDQYDQKINFHPKAQVKESLFEKLSQMKANNEDLDVITFAGNGEPTLHPEFGEIIDYTIQVRNKVFPQARIAVLSNSSMIHKKSIFKALNKIDDNILKLDGGTEETIINLNQPVGKFNLDNMVELLSKFDGNLIIQTLFIRGEYEDKIIDNTTNAELEAWISHLQKIKPKEVMIYTISRDTPSDNLEKISMNELEQIAKRVDAAGFKTQISS